MTSFKSQQMLANLKTYPTHKQFKHSDGDTSILSKTPVGN